MQRVIWILTVISIVSAIVIGVIFFESLPAEIPSHWDKDGRVDDMQSAFAYVWTLPTITAVFVGLLGIMANYMSDQRVRVRIALSAGLITLFLLGLHGLIGVRAVTGQAIMLVEFMRLFAGLCIGLSFVIRDVPPNHVVGFRLPWTMNDGDIWHKTHRVGFWGMFLGGLICLLVSFMEVPSTLVSILGIGSMLLGMIIPSIYSYWYSSKKSHMR
jgi:uncharacterized membrane protein